VSIADKAHDTIALNYQQDQYDVKHLKTTLTPATLELARETEGIPKKDSSC